MRVYPESALTQLEFDQIKDLLTAGCRTRYAQERSKDLRIHTAKPFIVTELNRTREYKLILGHQQYFPNDFHLDISREVKLLGIPGSLLSGEDWLLVRRLNESAGTIFRWFDAERRLAFPYLAAVLQDSYHEKAITTRIDEVLDETGVVRDNASDVLQQIRLKLFKRRNELRRMFEKVVQKLQKAGYSADIDESFSNGRRVVAVFAEHKRQVKGILHGESDSRKTAFIEPEETIDLNNEVYSLEQDEQKEILRILRALTSELSVYAPLLRSHLDKIGEYDFIR
ncbi:MAG: DNA mismatch repair protein MutS, partial [Sphingobacteriia bacterium]